ncbi:MAG TPA: hypothetical protein RMH99_13085 [Sandaracinaceae bacterium LLY-WYZ-13_1]|nr:hypothetical protein [Sandaracinaceae bacterium LLY-WYZ-13_1]
MRRVLLSIALASSLTACLDGHEPKAPFAERWVRFGRVRALLAGGVDGRGGGGGPVLVYLHGFASLPEDQRPLRDGLDVPAGTRFVFPEGPLGVTIPEGPRRAWWLLDRPLRRRLRAEPHGMRELAGTRPAGLTEARRGIEDLLDGIERRLGAPPERTLLAGFSQGAILATDVALRTDRPLAGLGILSGTTVAAQDWTPRMEDRRALPVFVTHGRADELLPFPMAERLVAELRTRGVDVRWHPHPEGHEMSPVIVPAFSAFVYETLAGPRTGVTADRTEIMPRSPARRRRAGANERP